MFPILVVRHVLRPEPWNTVIGAECRKATHAGSLYRALRVAEIVQLITVVDHRPEQQHTLLRLGQLLVRTHSETVVGIKTCKSIVVGHKKSFGTGLVQHRGIAQIIDNSGHVGVVPITGKITVNGVTPVGWSPLVQVVLRT